jgi:hypothetical protein
MTAHDPLCPDYPHARRVVCQCALIARVRANEAARHHHGGDCECTSAYEATIEHTLERCCDHDCSADPLAEAQP